MVVGDFYVPPNPTKYTHTLKLTIRLTSILERFTIWSGEISFVPQEIVSLLRQVNYYSGKDLPYEKINFSSFRCPRRLHLLNKSSALLAFSEFFDHQDGKYVCTIYLTNLTRGDRRNDLLVQISKNSWIYDGQDKTYLTSVFKHLTGNEELFEKNEYVKLSLIPGRPHYADLKYANEVKSIFIYR